MDDTSAELLRTAEERVVQRPPASPSTVPPPLFKPLATHLKPPTKLLTPRSTPPPQCDILLSAMTNLPPVIVVQLSAAQLRNARIANM